MSDDVIAQRWIKKNGKVYKQEAKVLLYVNAPGIPEKLKLGEIKEIEELFTELPIICFPVDRKGLLKKVTPWEISWTRD